KEDDTWGSRWTHIVVAPFSDSKYSGVLLYDQSTGFGKIYSTDGHGGMTLLKEYNNWRTTWTHIVAGKFYWDPPAKSPYAQFADLFFFQGSTRYGETYSTDGHGNIALLDSRSGFPETTDILAGNFGYLAWTQDNGHQEWTNLLFYNRSVQSGTIFTRGDTWLPVKPLSTSVTPLPLPVYAASR